MPRLVVVSRYLKSGSSKNLSNYVKYIATREGAATVKENNGTAPATKAQQELITSLLKDFSDSKNSFAYEEYRSSPTQKNASKFIEETIEHNSDIVANKKNYMGYLANRPGAVNERYHVSQRVQHIVIGGFCAAGVGIDHRKRLACVVVDEIKSIARVRTGQGITNNLAVLCDVGVNVSANIFTRSDPIHIILYNIYREII